MRKIATLFKPYFFLLFFLGFSQAVFATHIVGGVITYKYLGGTQYEVTIKVFKDCGPGANPFFDGDKTDPSVPDFVLGVVPDGAVNPIQTIIVPLNTSSIQILKPDFVNPCIVDPGTVCIQEATYKTTITLPNANLKYHLVYQRCCRNTGITNVDVYTGTGANGNSKPGATYVATIPPTNTYSNNSAVFNKFPPKYVCVNQPIVFNHSATDIDGDSLAYSLCSPLQGLNPMTPSTTSPSLVASPIPWTPPYSATDPLGGMPLSIDQNGVLTGTPNNQGQFVVGICVSEYRNGVLINTTLRDFQFNVINCPGAVANIPQLPGTIDPVTKIGYYEVSCDDYSVNFRHNSSNVGSQGVSWNFGEPSSGTNNTSTSATPSHTYSDTGTYLVKLIAYDASGCGDTAYTKVKIYPETKWGWTSVNACVGNAVLFTDTSNLSYNKITSRFWSFGDGFTGNGLNTNHIYPAAGSYNATLTSNTDKGCTKTIQQPITVFPKAASNFTALAPVCVNNTVQFQNTSTISTGYNIASQTWSISPSPLTNPILYSYGKDTSRFFGVAGNYTVKLNTVSDKGCLDSITKTITINPLPTITKSKDTLLCPNIPVTLSASGGTQYAWTPNQFINDTSISNPTVNPPTDKTYYVKVTDNNLCVNKDSIKISRYPKPNINAGLDTSVCLNPSPFVFRDSVRLTGTGAVTYSWTPTAGLNNPNVFNPLSKPSANTDYILRGVDVNGCIGFDTVRVIVLDPALDLIPTKDTSLCKYDTIQINVLDQGEITSYTWSPNYRISNNSIRLPYFYPLVNISYILTVSNYCYTKSDTIPIVVHDLPTIISPRLDSICIGQSYQMNVSGGIIYTWRPDTTLSAWNIPNPIATPKSDRRYYISIIDTFGCKNNDSINILVYLLPNLSIKNVPQYICTGDSVQLKADAPTGSVIWWTPDKNISDTSISNPYVKPDSTFTYFVYAKNFHGCINKDSAKINVIQHIKAAVLKDSLRTCENTPITLNASGGLTYLWKPTKNLNDSTRPSVVATVDTTTTFMVFVKNQCFIDSADVTIYIDSITPINAGRDTLIYRGGAATLTATPSTGLIYDWTPKDKVDKPYNASVVTSPIENTLYVVRAKNSFGCTDIDSVWVYVDGKTVILLPTAFSPNGNGINDGFGITYMTNIKELRNFSVYNRWGEKVFSTNAPSEKWDGTYKGKEQTNGVFVWTVEAVTYEDEQIKLSGNVTLMK